MQKAKRKLYPRVEIGDIFGRFTVTRQAESYINPTSGSPILRWNVRCSCGTETVRLDNHLKRGSSTNCGCAAKRVAVGERYGKLLVEKVETRERNHPWASCLCDCGRRKDVRASSLKSGCTKSCGRCRGAGKPKKMLPPRPARTHGLSKTPEYRAWYLMKRRCLNPKDAAYDRYGGRGIAVCDRWLYGEGGKSGFACFLADMGLRPSKRHTLERLGNERGYDPDNCAWREWEVQNRNRRNTVFVVFKGERVPLASLFPAKTREYERAHSRIFRHGWSVERALGTPSRVYRRAAR